MLPRAFQTVIDRTKKDKSNYLYEKGDHEGKNEGDHSSDEEYMGEIMKKQKGQPYNPNILRSHFEIPNPETPGFVSGVPAPYPPPSNFLNLPAEEPQKYPRPHAVVR